MDKYKHLLLWSTLLLSFFQVTNVQAAEERNPIYNPTNPTEEIYPIENTGTPEKWKKQMKVLLLAKRKRKKVAKTLVKKK